MHLHSRTAEDCRLRWANCRNPEIEQGPFTSDEDDCLNYVVNEVGIQRWHIVAFQQFRVSELTKVSTMPVGTERKMTSLAIKPYARTGPRSATQCAGRFQAHLNLFLIHSSWSQQEDDFLRSYVEWYGVGHWSEAVLWLPGHTHAQALHRWNKVLKPGRRKGPWIRDEDSALRITVSAFARTRKISMLSDKMKFSNIKLEGLGHHDIEFCQRLPVSCKCEDITETCSIDLPWSKISAHVITRTDMQCRERWTNVMDPTVVRPARMIWCQKNDDALRTATSEFTLYESSTECSGNNMVVAWSQVAQRMGQNLTDKMCRNRHRIISRAYTPNLS